MSRQLRIPRGVAVVGADLVDAAREIGYAEGHRDGRKEGYLAGLQEARRIVKNNPHGSPNYVQGLLQKEINKYV